MLQQLVGEKEVYTNQKNIFEDSSPSMQPEQPANVIGSAVGNEPAQERPIINPVQTEQPQTEQPQNNIFGNMFGDNSQNKPDDNQNSQEESKEDIPEVTPY